MVYHSEIVDFHLSVLNVVWLKKKTHTHSKEDVIMWKIVWNKWRGTKSKAKLSTHIVNAAIRETILGVIKISWNFTTNTEHTQHSRKRKTWWMRRERERQRDSPTPVNYIYNIAIALEYLHLSVCIKNVYRNKQLNVYFEVSSTFCVDLENWNPKKKFTK